MCIVAREGHSLALRMAPNVSLTAAQFFRAIEQWLEGPSPRILHTAALAGRGGLGLKEGEKEVQ